MMRDPLRSVKADIRTIVDAGIRHRISPEEVRRQVEELIQRNHLADASRRSPLVRQLMESASNQFGWIESRVMGAADRAAVLDIVEASANQFARIGDVIQSAVVDVFRRAIGEGLPYERIVGSLERELKIATRHAQTIANTGVQGFSRADAFRNAAIAGIEYFRYAGAGAQRDFCVYLLGQARAGRLWTLEEIQRLDNGQGLPVLYYCGGYNCRHRWEPVIT